MAVAPVGLTLDLKGLSCPLPIAKTAKAMRDVAPGALVEVFVTDPGSIADFKAWSESTGNPLVESGAEGGVYRYVIRKKEG